MTLTSRIRVSLKPYVYEDEEGIHLVVKLDSRRKPGLVSQSERSVPKNQSFESLRKLAEACGGALAEYQNEKYLDHHDPSECARATLEAFDRMVKGLEQGKPTEGIVTL